MRRAVFGAALAAAAAAVARRLRQPGTSVEAHYADGSMVRFDPGTSAGDDLLALARRALREAGTA